MLRKKLSVLILGTTMTNMASTPLTAFAETLRAENVIEESQQEEKKKQR